MIIKVCVQQCVLDTHWAIRIELNCDNLKSLTNIQFPCSLNNIENLGHNSPICDECRTQSAKAVSLPWNQEHQDNSNGTPTTCVRFMSGLCWSGTTRVTHSKVKTTWNSHIGCGVLFESSWWARSHSSVKTFAYWVWHSS